MEEIIDTLETSLNGAQREAVEWVERHLLVLAGAGSGKTRVITYKIIHLLETLKVPPHSILAITFTNKAAEEMRERVFKDIDSHLARGLHLRTFHSFGAMLLRMFADQLPPYDQRFTIADDEDKRRVLKEISKDEELSDHQLKALGRQISVWKDHSLFAHQDPKQMTQYFLSQRELEESLRYYQSYQHHLEKHNLMDFDDLIVLPVRLIRESEVCRRFVHSRWKYVLIDEYQDTNFAQEKLIEQFAQGGSVLTAVGDDDQSIYAFRGALIDNIRSFPTKYAGTKVACLEENYRSTKAILALANDVIKNNPRVYHKVLSTANEQGDLPRYQCFPSDYAECQWIIDLLLEHPVGSAVFYRSNYQSRLIEEYLIEERIPYQIIGGLKFYQRKEIKDIVAYLHFIFNPKDLVSLKRIINTPTRGLGKSSQEKIFYHIEREDQITDLTCLLQDAVLIESLPPRARKAIEAFTKLISCFRKRTDETRIAKFIEALLDQSGLLGELEKIGDSLERENRMGHLDQFLQSADDFERKHPKATVMDFLAEIMLRSEVDDLSVQKTRVKLMTIHSAKGLEFDQVFVMGMEEESFPHVFSLDTEADLQEERRLFYVAVTRAKKKLFLSGAQQKGRYGKVILCRPSRFIEEIESEHMEGEVETLAGDDGLDEQSGFEADPEYPDEHPYF